MNKFMSKIIVGILSLWSLFIIISELMGLTVYFPFNFVEKQEIPYHRINSIRLSVFVTFIYFGFRYICKKFNLVCIICFLFYES